MSNTSRLSPLARLFGLAACALATTAATATTAAAQPTTQACLGDFDTFLACPAGVSRSGTECRAREPSRGRAAGEHWSGSKRQGPAIFLRNDQEKDPAKQRVSFAAYYKDHKKSGRVFHFDRDGRLSSWSDVSENRYHGLSVSCTPDGRVYHLAYYDQDKVVGISRSWRMSDGAFSFAMDRDAAGKSRPVAATPEQQQRPDHLCRPARCDVQAKPELWPSAP